MIAEMRSIAKYFPEISQNQLGKLEQLYPVYEEWNSKINLISRKDFQFFYERHVLHSLTIAKFIQFPTGSKVLDAGTGGGFPGIPLAIFFPETHFHLVDSIGKKIHAVSNIATQLNLHNVSAACMRVENIRDQYNYIVSRAVAPLEQMIRLTGHLLVTNKTTEPKSGIIYLKGGDITAELKKINWFYRIYYLNEVFTEEYFETKMLVHLYP
jgi:16S rRNA (guanine527-N7)-methyltransferase